MPNNSAAQEPIEKAPTPAILTLTDGQVIPMPAALSADQVEALAYVATLFIEPLKAAALGQSLGDFMRRAALQIAREEVAKAKATEPALTESEG